MRSQHRAFGCPRHDTLIVVYTTNAYAGRYEHVTIVTIVTIEIVVTIVAGARTRHTGIRGRIQLESSTGHE
ncbi:hypothetical protein OCH74_06110 [Bifidobacterium thermacidophilum]|uniref:Uncharacterized protein n=1 Tax=Bifidobacterium thermacidophilum TaxID=246618 RepID=A0ABW8KPF6_9BIFI